MKICFIADSHMFHDQIEIPECNVLCHAGDHCSYGTKQESLKFLQWFEALKVEHKLFIAGNHDICWEQDRAWVQRILKQLSPNVRYLEDSGVTINGMMFWGSPWQPYFQNWAFNLPRGGDELYKKWQLIPRSTDILITHSPLNHILDRCAKTHPHYPQYAGCELLRHRVEEIGSIKIHATGHIHEGFGSSEVLNPTYCINCSICTLEYKPLNKPVVLEL